VPGELDRESAFETGQIQDPKLGYGPAADVGDGLHEALKLEIGPLAAKREHALTQMDEGVFVLINC
jgi:hypothetical protein